MARGLYRDAAFVYVSYDGVATVPISHALYEKRGYEPPLDQLPTKAKYEAKLY
jgi:hypothetical protein